MAQTLAQLIKGVNLASAPANSFTIDSSGRCGIGTTSLTEKLHVDGNIVTKLGGYGLLFGGSTCGINGDATTNYIQFYTNNVERARIDSSGRWLLGTSTARSMLGFTPGIQSEATSFSQGTLSLTMNSTAGNAYPILCFARSGGTTLGSNAVVSNNDIVGKMFFVAADGTDMDSSVATIEAVVDGTPGSNDLPGRIVFSTTADGSNIPTERMRIASTGELRIGTTNNLIGFTNQKLTVSGPSAFSNSANVVVGIDRLSTDGDLILFYQDTLLEGSISVSGSTVSYNGAHLSRWSQLPSGAERTEILRGSILSNIDEMCEWGDEENEQLNRMKVSDVEGDKNVSGVFQAWDDDDDTYTNDFYCAMTGDFIIRIAAGVTVERGDLLMSAGNGTAKPQDDDIIRSKTIAKVTSTNVSCTYSDGSYCVPCVLMAC